MNPVPYCVFTQKEDIQHLCDHLNDSCDELIKKNSQCWGLGPYAKNDEVWSSYPLTSNILSDGEHAFLIEQMKVLIGEYSNMLGIDHNKTKINIDESFLLDLRKDTLGTDYETNRYSHLSCYIFFDEGLMMMNNPFFNDDLGFYDDSPFFKKKIIQNFDKYSIFCLPSNVKHKYIIKGDNKKVVKSLIKFI